MLAVIINKIVLKSQVSVDCSDQSWDNPVFLPPPLLLSESQSDL